MSDSCRQALRHRTLSSCCDTLTHVHTRDREETVWQWISSSCRWCPPFKKNAEAAACPSAAASGSAEKVHKWLQSLNLPPFVPPHLHVFLNLLALLTARQHTVRQTHTNTHTCHSIDCLSVCIWNVGMKRWGATEMISLKILRSSGRVPGISVSRFVAKSSKNSVKTPRTL